MEAVVRDNINSWLEGGYDSETKKTIQQLLDQNKEQELTDAFYKDLEFGTGGLRGIMGTGSNRMNKYTVGKATQGLANYLKKSFNDSISVAIAYDSRNNSSYFADIVANIFSANDIQVYLFEELRPTPELSFAIRHFGCKSGVVLTASHNPKEYNGYKAYWEDGAQVIAPHDKNIIDEVNAITDVINIKFDGKPQLIKKIGHEVDEAYLQAIKELSVNPDVIKRQRDLSIVFSPIHGTGVTVVPSVLEKFGFENVHVVEKQATPDGNFPTVVYPNPEEAEALSIALNKAKELNADLVLATDPDADRVGIAVKNHQGDFQLLNGNQTGALLVYYMLQSWKDQQQYKGNEFIVKTIVTTELIAQLAKHFNVEYYDTLTGFKFIAGLIRDLEGKKQFIVGGEESYGYLVGDSVRDKDAVASCAFIAEMVAYAKDQGQSAFDLLLDLYIQFGFYKESLISITKKGKSGAEEIQAMMETFRKNPPKELAGSKVVKMIDYSSSESWDLNTNQKTSVDFPSSNVLQFFTEDGSKISARPSGTEPKIKFYFGVKAELIDKNQYDEVNTKLDNKIEKIIDDLELKS